MSFIVYCRMLIFSFFVKVLIIRYKSTLILIKDKNILY
ncbi:hypothetical protein RCH33_2451 [Flavobacterium daejeonense]|nr:hypothetical protein RCH33_2451 [Flavobacterium daejeonense]